MKCLKCNREYPRPLEIFTGALACPSCKTTLFDVSSKVDFRISEENEELYIQSEIAYHYALKAGTKVEYNKYLDEAVKLCKQAANTYNPKAMLRLAYFYDYDYVDKNRSELERCKIAKSYYRSICFGDLSYIDIDGTIELPNIQSLKENAALLYFNMLEGLDSDTKDSLGSKQIDADKLSLSKLYPSVIRGYDANNIAIFEHNQAESILDIVKTSDDKKNPPIFGCFRVHSTDAKKLFTLNNNEAFKYIKKGFDVYVVDEVDGIMDSNSRFVKLNMLSLINSEIINKDRNNIYLVFVNRGAKLSFWESIKIKPIYRQIVQDNFKVIRLFETDINGNSFTFSKDDLCWKNYRLKELLDEAKIYL